MGNVAHGLPYLDATITEDMAFDHNLMRRVLEEEKPKFTPGASSRYHFLTYGWLVDQIVRHTDDKRRGIGQFLREEVTEPNGIDFHIGLNLSQEYRVARISLPGIMDMISDMWSSARVFSLFYHYVTSDKNSDLNRAMTNPSWIDVWYKCTANNPEQHAMEQAAGFGIGNARSLGTIFNLLVTGHLVGKKMLTFLENPVINETGYLTDGNLAKGHGFFYAPAHGKEGGGLIHHPGHGCQQITFDIRNQIVIAYVTNALKMGYFDCCRNYWRIHQAVYDALGDSKF
ncbi:hypothetical protein KIN20_026698 [Parelaphostrongylus tenuis]|uniref:Beta-lactamase-related domain-containing protein n=1 Tax=Parelaphostrongylus tenuis TaxID=148309 RepID=A0AAD5QY99_PARTN|nr:hypothetical protein KIN20_026698 [Parelaphostrongylus tenuis]